MSFIITSKTRSIGNRAPRNAVSVNEASPVSSGLIGLWSTLNAGSVNGYVRDIARDAHLAPFRSPIATAAVDLQAVALSNSVSIQAAANIVAPSYTVNLDNYTLSILTRQRATGSQYQNMAGIGYNQSGSSPYLTCTWEMAADGTSVSAKYHDGTTYRSHGTDVPVTIGEWMWLTQTYEKGVAAKSYKNGVEISTSGTAAGTPGYLDGFLHFGISTYNGTAVNHDHIHMMMWDRVLAPSELRHLYAPQTRWDLYQTHRRTYSIPAAAATTSAPFIITSKTQGAPNVIHGVDYSSPLSRGLVTAIDMLHGVGLSRASGTEVIASIGDAHSSAASWGRGVEIETDGAIPFTHGKTNYDAGGSFTALIQYTGTGYFGGKELWDNVDAGVFFANFNSGEMNFTIDLQSVSTTGCPDLLDGKPHIYTVRLQGNGASDLYEIWVDGASYVSTAPGSQGSIDVGATAYLGNRSTLIRASGMSFGFFLAHDRYISDSEISILHSEAGRWSWAKSPRRKTYFIPGGPPITLSNGQVTGTDPVSVSVDSDTAGGTLYMISQLDSIAEPTGTQIKAGQDGAGGTPVHSDTIP